MTLAKIKILFPASEAGGDHVVVNMNQDLENNRSGSGRARESAVLEFNGLWQGECYRDWFDSEVEK